ncbi:MAG: hypothetical protein A2505_06690 [Deltaproteobacteria bacterium RIFOXYD12_FULL_55_16]|nr:MAG: hypothetical protein A2505_06690 [Deltaproteobacteria bacterium RIFOXYD12_FULL_55_16]
MIFSKISFLVLVASVLFIVGYLPAWQILVDTWAYSEEYSHAFLTVPIILYMIWGKRAILLEIKNPSLLGLCLVIFAIVLYLGSLLAQIQALMAVFMFLTIVGVIIYLLGVRAIKELTIPLILFAMLIPVHGQLYTQLTFPLQIKVSQACEIIISMFGITIFREGNILSLPGKSFEVVEACSGLRSVISLMTLSVIMGYFLLRKNSTKFILFAASIPTAILVNFSRIVVMLLLYHFFKLDLTEGILHIISGLGMFIVALFIMFILQRVLEFWELK